MSLYQKIAEKLQYISPNFYKKRYFKTLNNLNKDNFSERNVEPELVWIKEYLPKNAVILDIGANVGTFLYQLENKLDHEHIYAFEPNKKLYTRLKRLFPTCVYFLWRFLTKIQLRNLKFPLSMEKQLLPWYLKYFLQRKRRREKLYRESKGHKAGRMGRFGTFQQT
jgi:hypothetical protein